MKSLEELQPTILAEMMRALNDERARLESHLADYAAHTGETAAQPPRVSSFDGATLLIEGATADHATYLRGSGYNVTHTGELAIAKRRKTPRKAIDAGRAAMQGVKGGKKIKELQFFNDEFSIRTARKLFTEYVEAQSYRFFNQFLEDFDRVIVNARQREGHEDMDLPADRQDVAPLETNSGKGRAVATLDDFPFNGDRNAPLQTVKGDVAGAGGDPGVRVTEAA